MSDRVLARSGCGEDSGLANDDNVVPCGAVSTSADSMMPTSPEMKLSANASESGLMMAAMLALAKLGEKSWEFGELGARIDMVLRTIMRVPNIYIAMIDEEDHRIRFVYMRDRHDRHVDREMNGLGLTDQVYLTGRSMLLKRSKADEMLAKGVMVNHCLLYTSPSPRDRG